MRGDFVQVPRGTAHSFKNNSAENVKMLVFCSPAAAEGFFAEAFYPAVEGGTPPPTVTNDLKMRLMAAAGKYGVEMPPPPR